MLYPKTIYVKEDSEKVCICATVDGSVVWAQPILITQNQYFAKVVNDWNGLLNIDEKNNSIMSARMVAGRKESDNTFSGVMMGDWKGQDAETNITENTGIYGFNHGAASFGFRDNGTAFIGKSGSGRIEFLGDSGKITSPGGMTIDLDNGKITSEKFDLKVEPFGDKKDKSIYLSSTNNTYPLRIGENFSVKWDGTVTAESGRFKGEIEASSGWIGGWAINEGSIEGGSTILNADGSITAGNYFEVTSDGKLIAKEADFSGTIDADSGTLGNLKIDGTLTLDDDGELAFGDSLTIDNTNGLVTKKGTVGGWAIGTFTLTGGAVELSSSSGITANYITIKDKLKNGTNYGKIGYMLGNNNNYILGMWSNNHAVALESMKDMRLTSGGHILRGTTHTYHNINLDAGSNNEDIVTGWQEPGSIVCTGKGFHMQGMKYLVLPQYIMPKAQTEMKINSNNCLVEIDNDNKKIIFNCTVEGIAGSGSSTAVFG